MSRSKREIGARLPIRRGLSSGEAAVYLGIGSTKFLELVHEGRMPRPRVIDGRKLWDVDDLDAAFRSLPIDGAANTIAPDAENPWH